MAILQYKDPAANVDLVTESTVSANAEFVLCTDIGLNDQRMTPLSTMRLFVGAGDLEALTLVGGFTLRDGVVTNSKMAADAIGANELQANSVYTAAIQDDAVKTAAIADLAVTNGKIFADSIDARVIADDAVTLAAMANNSVGSSQIIANAVGNSEIATDAVGNAELQANSVDTDQYVAGSIPGTALGPSAITDLGAVPAPTDVTIINSIGTDAVIPLAIPGNAGLVTSEERAALTLDADSFAANNALTPAVQKSISLASLPDQAAGGSSRFVGWDDSGNLAKFDPGTLTATSRKDSVDDEGNATATLNVDFSTNAYDNKQYTLTQDTLLGTLTAPIPGEYQLWIKQDVTGFRALTTNLDLRPKINTFQINPDSNELTVIRLYYDGVNWHVG